MAKIGLPAKPYVSIISQGLPELFLLVYFENTLNRKL